jgi:amino acid adenylation domain-containing protein
LDPDDNAYNILESIELTGPVSTDLIGRALSNTATRHESFRMRFTAGMAGEPAVELLPNLPPTEQVDLSSMPPAEATLEARRLFAAWGQRPFGLSEEAPFRAIVFRLSAAHHLAGFAFHHIVGDGWSIGLFRKEFAWELGRLMGHHADPLPSPGSFLDYAARQWQRLETGEFDSQIGYWAAKLKGLSAPALIPDFQSPARIRRSGDRVLLRFPRGFETALNRMATHQGVTPFVVMLTAWQLLLQRRGAGSDIGVGSPIANRLTDETEAIAGFFTNTIVFRAELSGNLPFSALLPRAKDDVISALENQEAPFDRVVQYVNPSRTGGENGLFRAAFAFNHMDEPAVEGLTITWESHGTGSAKFDLLLSIDQRPSGLWGFLEYDTSLYRSETAEAIAAQFVRVLESVIHDPSQRTGEISLMSDRERNRILHHWNDTSRDFPEATVHELFVRTAQENPDATALVWLAPQPGQMTYRELDRQSAALADSLRESGLRPGMLAGISMERGPDVIVSILAILRCGCAYVPLDPAYPRPRIDAMVEDSGIGLVIGQRLSITSTGVQPIQHHWPEPVAYLMYTSGSTGKPKGIIIPHKGIVRLVFNQDFARMAPDETTLLISSISFDVSTFEIWAALLHGGTLALTPPPPIAPGTLPEIVRQLGVTTMWLTSTYFNAVIDEEPGGLRGVRQLLIGGEALSVPHIRKAIQHLPETRLINGYGPTENTTFTTCYTIPPDLDARVPSIPIGRPLANTETYILDATLHPVPPGVPGELCTSGAGLALGYWNRPDLTSQRFVLNPFADAPGAKLYRTGDLARYLPDGNIEFLGRLDRQVKMRGYRIELGEVENALRSHPEVRDATVQFVESADGGHLIAHAATALRQPDTIRAHLRGILPAHMIPQTIHVVDALPYNANGKLDMGALPEVTRPVRASRPPANSMEASLLNLWRQALRAPTADTATDFFEAGGHSLLAARLLVAVEREFGRRLTLANLFAAPTVEQMASLLLANTPSSRPEEWSVTKGPAASGTPIICMDDHPVMLNLARRVAGTRPFVGLSTAPYETVSEFTVQQIAQAQLKVLRRFAPDGPYLLCGWSISGVVALEAARCLAAEGEKVLWVGLLDTLNYALNPKEVAIEKVRHYWRRLTEDPIEFFGKAATVIKTTAGLPVTIPERERLLSLAAQAYLPDRYDGPVTLFKANEVSARIADPQYGWGGVLPNLDIRSVPGNHSNMFQEPNVDTLAREVLDAIPANSPATEAVLR